MLKLISVATLTCVIMLTSYGSDPFNDGFADKRVEAYLANSAKLYEDAAFAEVQGMTGKKCLALTYDNECEAEFHTVPVGDVKAYVLSFRGQWRNSETLDNNPTFEAAVDDTWRNGLAYVPAMTLSFLDPDEKPMKDEIFMTMPYGKWREYRFVFFPPEGAAQMKLKMKSGRNQGVFYVDNIRFEPVKGTPGETVLSFANSTKDSSGIVYGFRLPSSLQANSKGKLMLFSGYGNLTPPIRLDGAGKYRLYFKGEILRSKGGAASMTVQFFESTGKKIGEAVSNKLDSAPLEFSLPKEASRIRLLIYNHLIEEIKITRQD